ncbi:MAG: hypothetical protein ACLQVG_28095 [Terriglobia bacterium]
MRRSESGRITLKAILWLGFLAAVIFTGIKTIPVYVDNYQLQDYLTNQTPFWQTQHATEDVIRNNVLARAQDLDLPLAAEEVTVNASMNKVSVTVDLHVPVDLKVYTLQLHFTDSSENKSII